MSKGATEKDVDDLSRQVNRLLDQLGSEAKIIVDMTNSSLIYSSGFRKKSANKIKELFERSKFKKIALFGGNTMIRTTASFILVASGVSKIKIFNTKEKALKWLKAP
jgi:hypothetical protein